MAPRARRVVDSEPPEAVYAGVCARDGEPVEVDPECIGWRVLVLKHGASAKAYIDPETSKPYHLAPDGTGAEVLPPGRYQLLQVDLHGRHITQTKAGFVQVAENGDGTAASAGTCGGCQASLLSDVVKRQAEALCKVVEAFCGAGLKPKATGAVKEDGTAREMPDVPDGTAQVIVAVVEAIGPHVPQLVERFLPAKGAATANGAATPAPPPKV